MSSINNPTLKNEKSPPQQSDIIIDSGGKIHISFLWDDLRDIPGRINDFQNVPAALNSSAIQPWSAPKAELGHDFLQEYKSCRLCPKECGFDRLNKMHPTCGDFHLRVATFGISHGDEPEIRGTRGSGTIMLSGCPLRCPSCHNPEKVSNGVVTGPQDFISLCANLYMKGAHNIQILSPTVHLPVLKSILKSLKQGRFPIPIILKSSGYEHVEQLKAFEGLIDIYLPDFKFSQCSNESQKAGVKDYFARAHAAVCEMVRQRGPLICDDNGVATRGVLVRHVEIPLPNEGKKQIRNFLNSLPQGVRVSYQNNFASLE